MRHVEGSDNNHSGAGNASGYRVAPKAAEELPPKVTPPRLTHDGISPPIGGKKKRGRPRSSRSEQICTLMNISRRNFERVGRILRLGIPELVAFLERGDLGAGPAEIIAVLPHDLQRQICERGVSFIRRTANELRCNTGAEPEPVLAAKP